MSWRRVGPIAAAIVAMMLSTAPSVQAADRVLPPQAHPFGRTYAEWSALWWQWAISIPVHQPPYSGPVNHPLVDETGAKCGIGQEQQPGQHGGQFGDVWFLGGEFFPGPSPPAPPPPNPVVVKERDCSVPHGKALFFSPLNIECSMLEGDANGCGSTGDALRANIAPFIDAATNLTAHLDGNSIPIGSNFRVKSPGFSFSLPPDDILSWIGEGPNGFGKGPFNPGSPSGLAVADGYYVMLAPLSSGPHKLNFHGESTNPIFSLDVTYVLTVG